jgi:hypothetical protein
MVACENIKRSDGTCQDQKTISLANRNFSGRIGSSAKNCGSLRFQMNDLCQNL